ncbi:MAG: polysaccharide deacetylase family protein [Bacteroidaceae bacterium]|nr:polysaccharide deacetylase family protein [Bacteroidaceae bacterium]
MFIEQPNIFMKKMYPSALWRMDPEDRAVYLTFDDGPIPEVTPWVLDKLDQFNVKATFFMVGDNVRKHPDIFRMVVERGHGIGNHTMHHIKIFDRNSLRYMDDVREADQIIIGNLPGKEHFSLSPNGKQIRLFRPPHGFMNHYQYERVKWAGYKIVMWDLVTRDYSYKLRPPQVLSNVLRYTRNGSIITFHDSLRSWNGGNLQYALSHALWFLKEEGYQFKLL